MFPELSLSVSREGKFKPIIELDYNPLLCLFAGFAMLSNALNTDILAYPYGPFIKETADKFI